MEFSVELDNHITFSTCARDFYFLFCCVEVSSVVLFCIALHCVVIRCVVLHCVVLSCDPLCCVAIRCVVLCLHSVAIHCVLSAVLGCIAF